MDAFKTAEVKRMELGGNKPWKDFFNNHSSNKLLGRDFESCTIGERYDSEAGEEWKDRLTAKVEGTEYVPGSSRKRDTSAAAPKKAYVESAEGTPAGSGRNTPLSSSVRSPPPPQRTASPSQKARNEAYFAAKGSENASRPDGLAPSQGGKYGGFGSEPPPTSNNNSSGGIPTSDDFQKDPMAALTKGFGWLSSTVSKQASTLNTSYIQPGMKTLSEADIAQQARGAAVQAGSFVQQNTRNINDQFNKFVDPEYSHPNASGASAGSSGTRRAAEPEQRDFWDSFGQAPAGPPREKKGFWDDFAAAGEVATEKKQPKPTSIGTSAMKTTTGAGASGGKKEDDGWGAW
jgi:ADP-ribosylation factor GTPase-activating protein 1